MKTFNLLAALNCFAAAVLLDNGWLALIGFGNLFAFGLALSTEIYETLSKRTAE